MLHALLCAANHELTDFGKQQPDGTEERIEHVSCWQGVNSTHSSLVADDDWPHDQLTYDRPTRLFTADTILENHANRMPYLYGEYSAMKHRNHGSAAYPKCSQSAMTIHPQRVSLLSCQCWNVPVLTLTYAEAKLSIILLQAPQASQAAAMTRPYPCCLHSCLLASCLTLALPIGSMAATTKLTMLQLQAHCPGSLLVCHIQLTTA